MQAISVWSANVQHIQSLLVSFHPSIVQTSSRLTIQSPELPHQLRSHAVDIFRSNLPSLNHSPLLNNSFKPPSTALAVLCHLPRRPVRARQRILPTPSRQLWTPSWSWTKRLVGEKVASPFQQARVLRLEEEANASPNNVAKQVMLWRAILDLDIPFAYQRVISRWERLLEFVPQSRILRSDEAFQLYLKALVKTGQRNSLIKAAARRDQVLKASAAATAELSSATDTVEPEITAKSTSQDIADAVLVDPAVNSPSPLAALGLGSFASTPNPSDLSGAGTKAQPLHVYVEQPKGSVALAIGKTLLIVALYGLVTITVLGLVLDNSGLLKANSTVMEFEQEQANPVKFSDVHGVDEAKEELRDIVEFLKDPAMFSTLGGKLPKGVLLTGPPGTGKTMLAKAVAGEAGVPFFFASGSEFDEIFVGVGAKRIRELFAAARKKQPAIIFIDELDAIGGKRSPKDQQYMKQTLNQLLVELDGFNHTEGVIVIGATNFPESLDRALIRPGRFDRKVVVPLPDVKGRVQILKHHMKNVISDPQVDVTILARATPGFSGADLQNLINQAAIQASKEGSRTVTLKHFEWARDKVIMGPERRSTFIEAEVKKMTAYHEGGHALTALYTKGANPLYKVTCMPRGHALGVTSQLPEGDQFSVSYRQYIAEIDVCMGGRAAEELIYGRDEVTSGASSDLQRASNVARRLVKYYGYSDKIGPVVYDDDEAAMISPQKKDEIESEVRRILEESNTRVMKLLKSKEPELHRLALAMVEYETLDAEEVNKVISGKKIREGEVLAEA